ncbi:MAG: chemotaxis protein CheW [Pleurocapsa sp.]
MGRSLIDFQLQETTKNYPDSTIKLLVFDLGKLTLALPVEQVQKVIKHSAIYGSGLSYVNLLHLGEQEVAVIDLHRKLFKVSQPEIFNDKGYFIISKSVIGEPLGIMVAQTPSLIDVSLDRVRTLPNSYRHADTLAIASHVAVIPQPDNKSLTVFILDLKELI